MRPAYLPAYSLALALLLPPVSAGAAPPKPNFADMPAYLTALNQSQDPAALSIRRRIANGPADLARERAAAEQAGLPIHLSQLQQPLPPADRNAAPLYVELEALRKQKPLHLPLYAQPLNGRYAYTPEQLAAVQSVVDARQDIFTLLHQAADKPQCVFARTGQTPFDFPPEYAGLREDARELKTESLLLAYQGKYPQAVTNQERGLRMAAHAAGESNLLGFFVGSAIEAITLSGLQEILQKAGPDAALDSQTESAILAQPPLFLGHALSAEGIFGDWEFSQWRSANPAGLPAALAQAFPNGSPFLMARPDAPKAKFTPPEAAQFTNLLDAAEADYLHQLIRLSAAADAPSDQRDAVFGQVEARASANRYDPVEALSDRLNPVIGSDAIMESTPSLGRLTQQADRVAARRLVTAAGAAILAEKAKIGAFPSALSPNSTDPFSGKPLGYLLEGTSGFVVYSAGPSGTFDGGKPGDPQYGPNIMFRYPLVPVPIPADMLK